jgi:hypothetical protein
MKPNALYLRDAEQRAKTARSECLQQKWWKSRGSSGGEVSKKGAAPPETLAAAIKIFSDGCFLRKPSKSSKRKEEPSRSGGGRQLDRSFTDDSTLIDQMLDDDRQTVRRTVDKRPHDAQQGANDVGRETSSEITATTPNLYRQAANDECQEPSSEITATSTNLQGHAVSAIVGDYGDVA